MNPRPSPFPHPSQMGPAARPYCASAARPPLRPRRACAPCDRTVSAGASSPGRPRRTPSKRAYAARRQGTRMFRVERQTKSLHAKGKSAITTPEWILLGVGAFIIGLAKAGFGGGMGIAVAPMLATVMPSRAAIGLMLPLLLAGDVMTLVGYRGGWDRRNLIEILPGAIL